MPDELALAHSRRLAGLIREEVRAAGGWIPFARYMELALYAPGLGYYVAGARKLGTGGDFVTAPEISALFGRALARQVAQILERTDGAVLELGAGTGKLAAVLLAELGRLGRAPRRYQILEVSPELRERQRSLLAQRVPELLERVEWLETFPQQASGVVLGNEVLDAIPVHVVAWREEGVFERGVALAGDGFDWAERPAEADVRAAAEAIGLAPPYVSEIGLTARALIFTLARRLQRGVMLFIDYGFGRDEFYHPQRSGGTLMCHYRHRSHDDPFLFPGLQDITAHVDFTSIAQSSARAGLELLGYTTQAQFLLNCGITELLAETPVEDAAAYLPRSAAVQKLVSPAEMGELFKAIALGRGIDIPLMGFADGDKSLRL
ncbi:MAG: class I SAM-dependent methyltransferase [Burkholderiales bacterium]